MRAFVRRGRPMAADVVFINLGIKIIVRHGVPRAKRRMVVADPGDVVIVSHNGIEKIKRIERQQGDLIYLLGDNPSASTDSRDFGWLPAKTIIAKVVWPKL